MHEPTAAKTSLTVFYNAKGICLVYMTMTNISILVYCKLQKYAPPFCTQFLGKSGEGRLLKYLNCLIHTPSPSILSNILHERSTIITTAAAF